jgi:homoserine dehydrogenase
MHLRLLSLGFGNVGRAVAVMLAEKADELRERYGLTVSYTGVYTRSGGLVTYGDGADPALLIPVDWPAREDAGDAATAGGSGATVDEALRAIREVPADVVLELTTLDPRSGQPAIDHIRAALEAGRHVVTANKGPIAYAYRGLWALAAERGVALRFESTVMDGTPIFGMAEASLPATRIDGFRGLLNSTSNYVLSRMAAGELLDEAVEGAQRLGIAEADPSNDLEGWDAAVKATVLVNVLMGGDLRPGDVVRKGLGAEVMGRAQAHLLPGQTLKQVVEASRDGEGITAKVTLAALPPSDLLAHLSGMEAAIQFHTDTMQDLTIIEGEGGPGQTAFGVVADLVAIAHGARA